MPPDERSTKSAERCDLHPASPSVANCDGCALPLCLACAVLVRGRVLGTECLEEALGPGLPAEGAARPGVVEGAAEAHRGVKGS